MAKIFMWIDLSYSYDHCERLLLPAQKAKINPNLDLKSSWCEYFGLTIFFFPRIDDVQCSMAYKPTHGSQSNVQTIEEFFFQCTIMCSTFWVHESGGVSWGSNYGKTFSTLTSMETRLCNQPYEHLDLAVCMFAQLFYIVDTFPYDDGLMRRQKGILWFQ